MSETSWALSQIWNEVRDVDRTREYEPRDYIWASELGGSYYDRYWKMHGRTPETPPNLRSQRKFDAGNLTEWVVKQILIRARILKAAQTRVRFTDGLMDVSGKVDFIAGGKFDVVAIDELPEVLGDVGEAVLVKLAEKYPDGLAEQGLEIKSISAFAFNSVEKAPFHHHGLQAFHYAYNTGKPYHIVYINKDDLRMVEWVIMPDSQKWYDLYMQDISNMARVYAMTPAEVEDIKEPLLLFDEVEQKFKKNIQVEYSAYLPDYGFERPDMYADKAKVATRLNNVVKSVVAGKKLSKLNLEAMDLANKFYPPAVEIIQTMIKAKEGATE